MFFVLLWVLLPVIEGVPLLVLQGLVEAFQEVVEQSLAESIHLPAELYRLAGFLLHYVGGRTFLDVGKQHLNALLQHRQSGLAQLKGLLMLLQLGQDRAMLKLELNEDPA